MMMTFFLDDKERAVHFGIVVHIHGRHADGFEAYGVAAIGELCLMGNIEVLAEKTIDERSAFFAVCHPLIPAPRLPRGGMCDPQGHEPVSYISDSFSRFSLTVRSLLASSSFSCAE
jgi:hypothetical protein